MPSSTYFDRVVLERRALFLSFAVDRRLAVINKETMERILCEDVGHLVGPNDFNRSCVH